MNVFLQECGPLSPFKVQCDDTKQLTWQDFDICYNDQRLLQMLMDHTTPDDELKARLSPEDVTRLEYLDQRFDLPRVSIWTNPGKYSTLKRLVNADYKHIPVRMWTLSAWDTRVCSFAASHGHLEVLQWARTHGFPWNGWMCSVAAEYGHLHILQWLRSQNCPWGVDTCAFAAANGHLEVLQWARTNGCPWDRVTCSLAALGGHLEVLQWARVNGCPWDERICSSAARNGHLEVLQWAHANGCPWDEETCRSAAGNGHLEVLRWARANGCPEEQNCQQLSECHDTNA